MKGSVVVLSALLLAGSAFADDDSSRAKLMGQWQQTDGSGETKSAWTFEGLGRFHTRGQVCWRPNLGGVRVQYAGEGMCGQGCGPQGESVDVVQRAELVEMETVGSEVVKRSFSIAGDGDAMDIETTPIAPGGATETTHFKRVSAAAAKQ